MGINDDGGEKYNFTSTLFLKHQYKNYNVFFFQLFLHFQTGVFLLYL